MKVETTLVNGYLPDKYAKHTDPENKRHGLPIISPPLIFQEVPKGTQSIVLFLFDDDAIPVGGFTWIHWNALLIDPSFHELPENISQTAPSFLIQGRNSQAGALVGQKDMHVNQRYTGPQPPDRDHQYQLNAYALDVIPDVHNGYWWNELKRKMRGHVIDQSSLKFWSEK